MTGPIRLAAYLVLVSRAIQASAEPVETVVYRLNERTQSIVDLETPRHRVPAGQARAPGLVPADELQRLSRAAPEFAPYVELEPATGDDDVIAEFGIIGDDDRVAVSPTTDPPSSSIVHIFYVDDRGEDNLCSGAMVAEDAVLTAGHCVYTTDWHSDYVVIPGRNAAIQPFGACGVREINLFPEWLNLDPDYDLAVLILDCEIGAETGILDLRAFDNADIDSEAVIHGYPGEAIARGRQYRGAGQIVRASEFQVDHLIDTTGGMSGSPIFHEEASEILAVHTYMTPGPGWTPENDVAFINHATRLTDDRIATIEIWIGDGSGY